MLDKIFEPLLSNWWMLVLCLVVGLVLLVKGADWLVAGASAVAKRFGINDLVIGLTVVAFGTSMPEFVVNMVSVADGVTDLAVTNILGSNIINTFVILGCTALVWPIATQKRSRDFDIPVSICAGVTVMACVLVNLTFETNEGISFVGGIIMLVIFALFMYMTMRHAKDHPEEATVEKVEEMAVWKALMLILVGLVGLVVGGEMIVKSAVRVASNLGVSDAIIGLTVVALGTSLPELATSVVAAFRHNSDIALGNVVGSNIFNVFLILGVSACIRPLPSYDGIGIDAIVAAMGSVIVWILIKLSRRRNIERWGGALLLLVYAAYLTYRLMMI